MITPLQSELQEDTTGGRRRVLKLLVAFSAASTLAGGLVPIVGYLIPPDTGGNESGGLVLAGNTDDIPIGQGEVVSVGNKPVIITNTEQGVKAFSAICTHLGCIVMWDQPRNIIWCPCHDGQFSPVTGAVIAGPPPTPLPSIPISVDNEDIYVGEA